jgi:CRP/FNR family transcriptional regulator, cyclic AMP receptor protein
VSTRDIVDGLRQTPLFAACSTRQLRHIAAQGTQHDYSPGAVLCKQGKPGNDFFVILRGQGEVTRDGKRLRTLGPGDYFGEVALLGRSLGKAPRTATVIATTEMRCFLLRKSDFRSVIYQQDIAVSLLHALVDRLPERATPHPL